MKKGPYTSVVAEGGAGLGEVWAADKEALVGGEDRFIVARADDQGDKRAGQVAYEAGARRDIFDLGEGQVGFVGICARLLVAALGHLDVASGRRRWRDLLILDGEPLTEALLGHIALVKPGRVVFG